MLKSDHIDGLPNKASEKVLTLANDSNSGHIDKISVPDLLEDVPECRSDHRHSDMISSCV